MRIANRSSSKTGLSLLRAEKKLCNIVNEGKVVMVNGI